MQGIYHRVAAMLVLAVARRQEDDHVAVDRVSLQVALQSRAVNLDVLNRNAALRRQQSEALESAPGRQSWSRVVMAIANTTTQNKFVVFIAVLTWKLVVITWADCRQSASSAACLVSTGHSIPPQVCIHAAGRQVTVADTNL